MSSGGRIAIVYNGGPHPDKDIQRFLAFVKKRFPNATPYDVRWLYKRAIEDYEPASRNRVIFLLGREIMSEHPERNCPMWPYLPEHVQRAILRFPINSGDVAVGETPGERLVARKELLAREDRSTVNRAAMISLDGLEETYVWRKSTKWEQEVLNTDWELIQRHPSVARRFHPFEIGGPMTVIRSYDFDKSALREVEVAKTSDDVNQLVKSKRRNPHYQGVDVKPNA